MRERCFLTVVDPTEAKAHEDWQRQRAGLEDVSAKQRGAMVPFPKTDGCGIDAALRMASFYDESYWRSDRCRAGTAAVAITASIVPVYGYAMLSSGRRTPTRENALRRTFCCAGTSSGARVEPSILYTKGGWPPRMRFVLGANRRRTNGVSEPAHAARLGGEDRRRRALKAAQTPQRFLIHRARDRRRLGNAGGPRCAQARAGRAPDRASATILM